MSEFLLGEIVLSVSCLSVDAVTQAAVNRKEQRTESAQVFGV